MKKLAIFALSAAGAGALMVVPAMAGDGPGRDKGPTTRAEVQQKVQQRLALLDADKDNSVSKAEFDAHIAKRKAEGEARRGERFTAMDTDKNGQISRAEFDAAHQMRPDRDKPDRDKEARSDRKERGGERMGERKDSMGAHHRMRGHGGMMMGGQWFERLDANKDGKVTLAEASARPLQMFDAADTNKDGTLSDDERKAAREARKAEWKAKRAS